MTPTPNPKKAEVENEFLTSAGWRFVTKQRHKYGVIEYWEHPDHQKSNGLWHTKGEAESIQRDIDKEWKTRKRYEGKLRHG